MVRARRRFLERGHYEPLSRAINIHANRQLSVKGEEGQELTAVEVGCGEGYYIGRLAQAVPPASHGHAYCFFGLDISKEAVRRAARTYADVCFLVNDVKHRICVADRGANLLLNVFAPRNPGEFERVMRPGGLLVVAIPHEDHLRELRERLPLLGIEPAKRQRTMEQFGEAFDLEADDALAYRRDMAAEEVLDLLRMTPNYWHLEEATLADVAAWERVSVTISILLLCFRRR